MWRIRQGGSRSARGVGGFPVCWADESWCGERTRRGRCGQGRRGPWAGTTRRRPEELEKATGRQGGPMSGGWTGKEVLAEGPVVSVQTGGPHWPFQGLQGHG